MPPPPAPQQQVGPSFQAVSSGGVPAATHDVPPTPVTNGWLDGSSTASVSPEYPLDRQSSEALVPGGGEDALSLGGRLVEEHALGLDGVAPVLGLAQPPRGGDDRGLVIAHDGAVGVVEAGVGVRALVDEDAGAGGQAGHLLDVDVGLADPRAPARAAVDVHGGHRRVGSVARLISGDIARAVALQFEEGHGGARPEVTRPIEAREAVGRRHLVGRLGLVGRPLARGRRAGLRAAATTMGPGRACAPDPPSCSREQRAPGA